MKENEKLLTRALLGAWPRCVECGGLADYRPRDAKYRACMCKRCVRGAPYPRTDEVMEPIPGAEAMQLLELRLQAEGG